MKDRLLFRREFVLLAALLQLAAVREQFKRTSKLTVYARPGIIVGRIAEIPVGGKRLFDAKSISGLLVLIVAGVPTFLLA